MSSTRSGVTVVRAALILALAGALTFAFAAVAQAKRVTGGQTTVTIAQPVADAMTADGIAFAPVAPATASGNAVTLPVAGGSISANLRNAAIRHRGGVTFTKGTNSVNAVNPLALASRGRAVMVLRLKPCRRAFGNRRAKQSRRGGLRRGHHRGRFQLIRRCFMRPPIVALRLRDIQISENAGVVTATANLRLTRQAANQLNRRLGSTVFSGGMAFGSVNSSLQLAQPPQTS
jgi:hypothetical protein